MNDIDHDAALPGEPAWCTRFRHRLSLLQALDTPYPSTDLGAPVPVHRIEAFERTAGVRLPTDYRNFIRYVGDGSARWGLMPLERIRPMTEEPWTDLTPREAAQIPPARFGAPFVLEGPWAPVEDDDRPPIPTGTHLYDGTLSIAEFGCAKFAFLVLAGKHLGSVWYDATVIGFPVELDAPSFSRWICPKVDTGLLELCGIVAKDALAEGRRSSNHETLTLAGPISIQIAHERADLAAWAGYLQLYLGDVPRAQQQLHRANDAGIGYPCQELREALGKATG